MLSSKINWLKISVINLAIVALFGMVMRYKIGFEFPFFEQKHLQHAHSHFAFLGWVAQTIYTLLFYFISDFVDDVRKKAYNQLLALNLVCAYAMLISFFIQGYGGVSIFFSTLSIVLSYFFTGYFFTDFKKVPTNHPSKNWFKAALIFNVLSSLGTFALAYMMVTKNIHEKEYLTSVYFYLHFQYNGFFFFGCMGLFISQLHKLFKLEESSKSIFWLFAIACFPAYLLSILWIGLPLWLYIIAVISAVIQVIGWILLLNIIRKNSSELKSKLTKPWRTYYLLVGGALSIKLLLQLTATNVDISNMVFSFRPIVIAYLHLVLLAITTIFLLVYCFSNKLLLVTETSKKALLVFVIGVFLNELVLMCQGIASFSYTLLPYVNESIFIISALLFFSLIALVLSQNKKESHIKLEN